MRYELLKDGRKVFENDDFFSIVNYIHSNHCYSFDHAVKYEGYKVFDTLKLVKGHDPKAAKFA